MARSTSTSASEAETKALNLKAPEGYLQYRRVVATRVLLPVPMVVVVSSKL